MQNMSEKVMNLYMIYHFQKIENVKASLKTTCRNDN